MATNVSRRAVLAGTTACAASLAPGDGSTRPEDGRAPLSGRVIFFDAFTVFDPRALDREAEALWPGRGAALVAAWRASQFEYAWVSRLADRYRDFDHLTGLALEAAAARLRLRLAPFARARLLEQHRALPAWPEARAALGELRAEGRRLALLSNFTPDMLEGCLAASGLVDIFERALSTDARRTYKPDPAAYDIGVEAFQVIADEAVFVAFAPWDAFGAKAFGYPTFWNNRAGRPLEPLGLPPDGEGPTLRELHAFLKLQA